MIVATVTLIITTLSLLMSSSVEAQCTLCEGTFAIPNMNAMIGGQTCIDASMDAIFYNEESAICVALRNQARFICGCEEKPVEEEKEEGKSDTEKEQEEKEPPTSGAKEETITETTTESPTSIVDRKPNCQNLIGGIYPFPESYAESVEIRYNAELMLRNDITQLESDIVEKFEDAASRLVSAGAAGCYNRRRLGHSQTKFLRKMEADDHMIHFVKFFDLEERNQDSCSGANLKDPTSTCFAVQGKIDVIYSSLKPINENANHVWAEELVLEIFNTQSISISNVVQEVTKYNNIQSAFDPQSALSSSNSLVIGLGIGFSIFAIITAILSILFVQRRRSSNPSHQIRRNQRRARKLEKKIERVEIMSKNYGQSDDSFVEYVDDGFLYNDGDDSVTDAPSVAFKKIYSLENTIATKASNSNDGSEENKDIRINAHYRVSSSSASDSSDDDDEEDNNEENSNISFPLYGFEASSVGPSILSEITTPYDEAASYASETQRPSRNNVTTITYRDNSLQYVNQDGQVAHKKEVRREFHC